MCKEIYSRMCAKTGPINVKTLAKAYAAVQLIVRHRYLLARGFVHCIYALLRRSGLGRTEILYDPSVLGRRRAVVLCNHVSAIDWILLWIALERLGHKRIMFCMRRFSGLMRPMNTFFRSLGFAVIQQRLDEDYITLTAVCDHLYEQKGDYCFVIFPEGRLRNSALCKGRYAKEEEVPLVMPVHSRGTSIALQRLSDAVVIDCTLVYNDHRALTKHSLLPSSSRIVARVIDRPSNDNVADWLDHLFINIKTELIEDMLSNTKQICIERPRSTTSDTALFKVLDMVARRETALGVTCSFVMWRLWRWIKKGGAQSVGKLGRV